MRDVRACATPGLLAAPNPEQVREGTMETKKDLNEYKWELFFDEFQNESPRASVIISGALIDTLLRDLLVTFMVNDKKEVDSLVGSEKDVDKPLGAFGARIKAAYCLGLISKEEYSDLKIIQKVRNQFAHKLHGFSFDDPMIVDLCNSLRQPEILKDTNAGKFQSHRDKYLISVAILTQRMGLRILSTQREKRSVLK